MTVLDWCMIDTYAMSRNVNFWLVQRLIFVSTAYLGPIEPISIVTQIKSGGRFQSSPKMLIFLNFFGPKKVFLEVNRP